MAEAAPRPHKRVRFPGITPADPIAAAMETDSIKVASDLEEALAGLDAVTESSVKIIVYRVSARGEWEHVKQLSPPLKVGELVNDVEDTYGPGKYAVRIMADNKIKTTKFFNIAQPKDERRSVFSGADGLSAGSLLKLLLERDKGAGGSSDMFMLMMKMQQDSAATMMQMQQASTQQMLGLMTALMTGRGDPAEQFLKSAEIIKAMQGPQTTAKDVLETFAMVRDIAGEGGGHDGILGLAEKFLPAVATLAAASGQGAPPAAAGPARAALPPPGPSASRAPPPAVLGASGAGGEAPPAEAEAPAPGHPILSLVQPEIEFFMARGHDPELAAEAVADVLQAKGVTAESLFAFGLEIQGPDGNYVGRLQQLGLDVAGHTAWFESMLGFLAEIYGSEDDAGEPNPGELDAGQVDAGGPVAAPIADDIEPPGSRAGTNGRGADPSVDAGPSAPRRPANKNPKSGRTAH